MAFDTIDYDIFLKQFWDWRRRMLCSGFTFSVGGSSPCCGCREGRKGQILVPCNVGCLRVLKCYFSSLTSTWGHWEKSSSDRDWYHIDNTQLYISIPDQPSNFVLILIHYLETGWEENSFNSTLAKKSISEFLIPGPEEILSLSSAGVALLWEEMVYSLGIFFNSWFLLKEQVAVMGKRALHMSISCGNYKCFWTRKVQCLPCALEEVPLKTIWKLQVVHNAVVCTVYHTCSAVIWVTQASSSFADIL